MSEAMTNREIEDVLTSIRRLVAQEGTRPTEAGRLILTEELRVSAAAVAAAVAATEASNSGTRAPVMTEGADASGPRADGSIEPKLHLNTGAESVENAEENLTVSTAETLASVAQTLSLPEPDFGKLEATIAELEAAVSASGEGWEAEASVSDTPRPSNVTDLYGRLSFKHSASADTAEPAPVFVEPAPVSAEPAPIADESIADEPVVVPEPAVELPHDQAIAPSAPVEAVTEAVTEAVAEAAPEPVPESVLPEPVLPTTDTTAVEDITFALPETEDAAFDRALARAAMAEDEVSDEAADEVGDFDVEDDVEEDVFDEDMLRALVAQIVREELHGQLGERVTQQVRKLVRSEIAKALDERKFL
jgi:hypothetical protein